MVDLLEIENLNVQFETPVGRFTAVNDVSFSMGAERIGIVGESGSGKSLTARSIAGLLPPKALVTAETLAFEGRSLLAFGAKAWTQFRGADVGLVLQDPKSALNPVLPIGAQVEEALRYHTRFGKAERKDRALAAMEAVGLPSPQKLYAAYPHELSGGMGQRVMIAAMLVTEPKLLIADEPTSALDLALRDQILDLLTGLVESRNMGLILISHDLGQVARYCQKALVMYRGRIVDRAPAAALSHSSHPYTRTLWDCRPSAATHGHMLPTLDRAALERLL